MTPVGLTQRVVLNMFESFFRRPFVHLVPAILLLGLGVFVASGTPKEYRSVGVLNVSSGSLLADITDAPAAPAFGFETPAVQTARTFNNLLQTAPFLRTLIDKAGLGSALESGVLTADEIKSSITVEGFPDNVVAISVTSSRPEQSQRVAQAALDTFREFVIDNSLGDAALRLEVQTNRLEAAQARYLAARQEFDEYRIAHPEPTGDAERPVEENLELERQGENVARANTAVQEAETSVADAQVGVDAATAAISRQLAIIDQPLLAETPQPRLQTAALTVVLFGCLGALISLGLVLVSALLDRTVRTPNDVAAKFGLPVLAVVPTAKR